jgi:hypothetical protein
MYLFPLPSAALAGISGSCPERRRCNLQGEAMAETIDELTIRYEEGGKILRRELAREVLSKGSWTTIMFLYQDLDRKTDEYGAPKVSIRRYQKREGNYLQRSKFEISSAAQARAICSKIHEWFPAEET